MSRCQALARSRVNGINDSVDRTAQRGAGLFVLRTFELEACAVDAGALGERFALFGGWAASSDQRLGYIALEQPLFGFVARRTRLVDGEVERIRIEDDEDIALGHARARAHGDALHRARHLGAECNRRVGAYLSGGGNPEDEVAIARVFSDDGEGELRGTSGIAVGGGHRGGNGGIGGRGGGWFGTGEGEQQREKHAAPRRTLRFANQSSYQA